MNRNDLLELTNKVYRQTLLFPKKEPLRYKIRELADDILAEAIEWEALHSPNPGSFSASGVSKKKDLLFEIEKNIELIKTYFNIVKWQNWVSYFDVLKIEEEYNKMEEYFKEKTVLIPKEESKPVKKIVKKTKVDLDARKQKIIDILKRKEKIQVGEVKDILKDVSKRTLRRDFDFLLKQDLVERIGESNNTFYKLR